jgi:hypothetical protein
MRSSNQGIDILNNASKIYSKAQDLTDKIHPHVIRTNVWSVYLRFANDTFPILSKYIRLLIGLYLIYLTSRNGFLSKIIDFITSSNNNILFAVGCFTFVAISFINKKWK